MIGVTVTFSYVGDFDRSRVTKVAQNARGMFEGMPGLRFKFFTFDEKQQRAVNFYVWDSEEAAQRFFSEELRERVACTASRQPLSSWRSPRSSTIRHLK
jgi:heme-degrading monooxygenase HmoA